MPKTKLTARTPVEEQIERLAMAALGMVPGFTPAKRKKLRKRLSPSIPKKAHGRPLKWDQERYWYLLLHMAGWQDGDNLTDPPALTRKQALAKLAAIYGVSSCEIEERIALARKKVPPQDLPAWARWTLIPGAKRPE